MRNKNRKIGGLSAQAKESWGRGKYGAGIQSARWCLKGRDFDAAKAEIESLLQSSTEDIPADLSLSLANAVSAAESGDEFELRRHLREAIDLTYQRTPSGLRTDEAATRISPEPLF
ncbi:MAG: hypothetical protein V4671_33155 [Armatimonadota bacterium]